jgi:hypothetical protein
MDCCTMRAFLLPLVGLLGLSACSSAASSTGAGGGSSSSSSAGGAGGTKPVGMPITAPSGTWTWVPFDDAHCGNGSTTGIGINPSTASDRVLIYLEGGGACWSEVTCYTFMTASYFTTGYGEAEFEAEATDTTYLAEPGGFFDRTAAGNPFKDYSYVYVPYCTGDVHAGDNEMAFGSQMASFVGYKNVAAYLERIVPTFPSADRVYLAGSSAGGFGATFNWWQTQKAFGSVQVDLSDDSGTPMPPDVLAEGNGDTPTEAAAWNLAATLPPGCTNCTKDLTQSFAFYAKAFPGQRAALLSYTLDSVLPTYFGISESEFTTGLDELTAAQFDPTANFKYFEVNASGHVLWFDPQLTTNGVTLQQFLTQMVDDDKDWASVHP